MCALKAATSALKVSVVVVWWGRRPGETEMLHISKAKTLQSVRHKGAEEYVRETVTYYQQMKTEG